MRLGPWPRLNLVRNGVVAGLMAIVLCLGSVAAVSASLDFKLMAASAENLGEPHDIVLSPDGKRLMVADNENNRIAVLEAASLTEMGAFGNNELSAPHDVVFDAQGHLLVADTGNHRIAIYDIDGAAGRLIGALEGRIRSPEGVGVHTDGRVFAIGTGSGNLVVFDGESIVAEVGGFSSPHDVEFDASGRAWVADASNDRLVRLNEALEIELVLSGDAYSFNGPRYLDFDAAGRLFVADKYSNQVKIIAPDGRLLQALGRAQAGKGEGVFRRPEGVEIKGSDVWISDTYNDRIVRYRVTSR